MRMVDGYRFLAPYYISLGSRLCYSNNAPISAYRSWLDERVNWKYKQLDRGSVRL